ELGPVREVHRPHPPRRVLLREEHLLLRPSLRPPVPDPALQRPQLTRLELPRPPPAQRLEDRLRLELALRVLHQQRLDLRRPHLRERIGPRPPCPRRLRRRGQRSTLPLPPGPLAHPGRCRGRLQRLACHPLLPQQADLLVRDHPGLPEPRHPVGAPSGPTL